MADPEKTEPREGIHLSKKSPAANPSVWRPDLTTLRAEESMLPQEMKWPNDSAHHV